VCLSSRDLWVKDLTDYTRADALKYRGYLIAKGMAGSSVSRVISSIRAVMKFAISEYALDLKKDLCITPIFMNTHYFTQ
jgi:site-specific recombinase XerD